MTIQLGVAVICTLALAYVAWAICKKFPLGEKAHWGLKILFVLLIVAVPAFLALKVCWLPVWAGPQPSTWNRPLFTYGFPFPCKFDSLGGAKDYDGVLCLNWLFWTCYLMFVLGYRKWMSYFVAGALVVAASAVLFGRFLFV